MAMEESVCLVGDYLVEDIIGRGTYAEVRRAIHKVTGVQVAMKIIDKSQRSTEDLRRLQMECYVQARLKHPNIVQLYEVIESDTHVFMILELARGGELLNFVNAHGRFIESEASTLFLQLVEAIEHTHSSGFVNRDIKLDNILIKDGRLVVGDWGFASTWSKDKKHVSSVGSLKYCSPEIVNGRPYVGPEVDVWSLGVVLYALISGRLPFNGATVRSDISAARFNMPADASEELRMLLSTMLCADPSKRASISDVKNSAWMIRHQPHLLRLRTAPYKVQRRSSGSTLRRSDPTRSWDRARNPDVPIVSVPAV